MGFNFETVIEGEFITLKKVTVADAMDIYKWRTSESGRFLRQPANYSLDFQIDWINKRTENEMNFIIYKKNSTNKIGMIAIYEVNFDDKVTNVGRLLLSSEYLKKSNPYGLEALLLTYNYVFEIMNFEKIAGTVLGTNLKMLELQKLLGMQVEGYLKRHVVIHNKREDLFIMSLFTKDFPNYKGKVNLFLRGFRGKD